MNNNNITSLIVWVVLIGGLFAFMWYKGYLLRIGNYAAETREELRKCSWPTAEELRGSTAVVVITIAMLGAFTAIVDLVLSTVLGWVTTV